MIGGKMLDGCYDDSALDTRSAALKQLIKHLMLVDNPKRGDDATVEVKSVSVDGDAIPEDEKQALSELIKKKEDEPEEDLEDIVNYKRV